MYLGEMVELAETAMLFREPRHPYTQALLAAIPEPTTQRRRTLVPIEGEIPSPIDPPSGCRFHPRCPRAEAICREQKPAFRRARPQPSRRLPLRLILPRCFLRRPPVAAPQAFDNIEIEVARSGGFEPPTPRFVVWCSIQLSYERARRGARRRPRGGPYPNRIRAARAWLAARTTHGSSPWRARRERAEV